MKSRAVFISSIVVIAMLIALIIGYIYVLILPSSKWFTYISMENVSANRDIIMMSKFTKPIQSTLTYNDVLRCDMGKGIVRYSSNLSQSAAAPHETKTTLWRYEGRTPSVETVCTMSSDISTRVMFGIEKSASVSSQMFVFKP